MSLRGTNTTWQSPREFQIISLAMTDMQTFLKFLDTPIQFLKGVGPRLADLLTKLNIKTFEDLLYHIPHRYIDFKAIESLR